MFSEQDVIKDPLFSKLDLVTCRNLLIYLNAELQRERVSAIRDADGTPTSLLLVSFDEDANP